MDNSNINEKEFLDFISWSYSENKTNSTTQMTFTFDDSQRLVTQFCYNATRTSNGTSTNLGLFCVDSYAGQVVQTFGLTTNQYIDFTFQFTFENKTTVLNKVRSYSINADLLELETKGVWDLLFIFIYFGAISLLLSFKNYDWYLWGILGVLLIGLSIQAVLNQSWIDLGIWGFMAIKSLALYSVRYEG